MANQFGNFCIESALHCDKSSKPKKNENENQERNKEILTAESAILERERRRKPNNKRDKSRPPPRIEG